MPVFILRFFSFAFFLLMLNFTNLSSSLIIKLIPSIVFTIVSLILINLTKSIVDLKLSRNIALFLFLVMISVGIFRDNHPEHTGLLVYYRVFNLLLFSWVFVKTLNYHYKVKSIKIQEVFFYMIYLPLLYLILINLIFYFLFGSVLNSIETSEIGSSVMLSTLTGVNYPRVHFLFSNGFNNYGAIVGLLLIFSLIGWKIIRQSKRVFVIGVLSSIITLLFIDTRTAMVFPILIFLFIFHSYRFYKKPKFLWLLPVLTVFGSNLLLLVLGLFNTPFFKSFSRSASDFSTANSRSFIWLFSSLEFLNFKDIHLIGWGEYGHYESGVSKNWKFIFETWDNSELMSPHSNFYMILFDYGYLGLLLIVLLQILVISVVKKYWSIDREICLYIVSFFLYWNLLGMTESFFGFYANNIMYIFIGVLMIVFSMKSNYKSILKKNI